MKPIEIHIEGYKIVITKEDEQPNITKDEKITIPSYPNYQVVPTNPNSDILWAYGGPSVTNMETKCETPVRDRMVGKVSE